MTPEQWNALVDGEMSVGCGALLMMLGGVLFAAGFLLGAWLT
jgi:hypothetical protein